VVEMLQSRVTVDRSALHRRFSLTDTPERVYVSQSP
jgi:hypothetical protein